jgi:hypothetical protein
MESRMRAIVRLLPGQGGLCGKITMSCSYRILPGQDFPGKIVEATPGIEPG